MNYVQKTLVLLLCCSTFLSCEKITDVTFDVFDVGGANMLAPEDMKYFNYYKDKLNVKGDLVFDVQSNGSGYLKKRTTPSINSYKMGGYFGDKINVNVNESSIQANDILMNYREGYGYVLNNFSHEYISGGTPPIAQLFGKSIDVIFTYLPVENNQRNESATSSMYVPEELILTSPVPVELGISEYFAINNSTLDIEWESDVNNEHGILIGIKWNGATIENPLVISSAIVKNIKLIDDDGQFSITEEFFEGITSGALVDFFMIRGNIVIDEVNDQIIELKATSTIRHSRIVYE